MKKAIAIFAIVALVACNGSASTETKVDSVGTQVDSTAVSAVDSTVAQIGADSTSAK